jgi:Holliday junction resolvase RusA-like endonuclease
MKIVIEGVPIPKARARIFNKRGQFSAFDPQHEEKKLTSIRMKNKAMRECYKFDTESIYKVVMWFYIPYPSKCSLSQIKEHSWGFDNILPQKPDISNYVKFYEDAANGILWYDDSSIVDLHAFKIYSSNPRTEIDIMKYEKNEIDSMVSNFVQTYSKEEFHELMLDMDNLANCYDPDDSSIEKLFHLAKQLVSFAEIHTDKLKKILIKSKKSHIS